MANKDSIATTLESQSKRFRELYEKVKDSQDLAAIELYRSAAERCRLTADQIRKAEEADIQAVLRVVDRAYVNYMHDKQIPGKHQKIYTELSEIFSKAGQGLCKLSVF